MHFSGNAKETKGRVTDMNLTEKQYARMVSQAMPKSRILKNSLCAFGVGGAICVCGQALTDLYLYAAGMELKDARCATGITLIALSVLLTAFSLYDNLARHAGAGTLVPITGFANAIASPAIEFKSEGLIMGLGAKMFVIAGPVIVYGAAASIVYGLIYFTVRSLS